MTRVALGLASLATIFSFGSSALAFTGPMPSRAQQKQVTAQITIHTDHGFWSKLNVEGTELHFDPIAARAAADGTVTIDDLAGVDVTAFSTRAGTPLPGRSLVEGFTPAPGTLAYTRWSSGTARTPVTFGNPSSSRRILFSWVSKISSFPAPIMET